MRDYRTSYLSLTNGSVLDNKHLHTGISELNITSNGLSRVVLLSGEPRVCLDRLTTDLLCEALEGVQVGWSTADSHLTVSPLIWYRVEETSGEEMVRS